jgi:hypothetical protein
MIPLIPSPGSPNTTSTPQSNSVSTNTSAAVIRNSSVQNQNRGLPQGRMQLQFASPGWVPNVWRGRPVQAAPRKFVIYQPTSVTHELISTLSGSNACGGGSIPYSLHCDSYSTGRRALSRHSREFAASHSRRNVSALTKSEYFVSERMHHSMKTGNGQNVSPAVVRTG